MVQGCGAGSEEYHPVLFGKTSPEFPFMEPKQPELIKKKLPWLLNPGKNQAPSKSQEKKLTNPGSSTPDKKINSKHGFCRPRQVDRVGRGPGQPFLWYLLQGLQQAGEIRPLVRIKQPTLHQNVLHVPVGLKIKKGIIKDFDIQRA